MQQTEKQIEDQREEDSNKLQEEVRQIRPNKEQEKRQFVQDKQEQEEEAAPTSSGSSRTKLLGRVKRRALGHWALDSSKWLKKSSGL